MKIARYIYAETYQPFHVFGIAAVIYLCVNFVLIFGFKKIREVLFSISALLVSLF